MTRTDRVDQFLLTYIPQLAASVAAEPTEYAYGVESVPAVAIKMRAAFIRGTYSHDSATIRRACRLLGIKPTRKALESYFGPLNVAQDTEAVA